MITPTKNLLFDNPLGPVDSTRSQTLTALLGVRWFIHLRWLAVVSAFVLLSAELWISQWGRPLYTALGIIAGLAATNVCWTIWSRRLRRFDGRQPDNRQLIQSQAVIFINAQIATDLLLLTLVLASYGGVVNPMAMFYVFHMVIASILLRPVNALLQGVWAMVLYGLMLLGEHYGWWPAPHPLMGHHAFAAIHSDGLIVLKMYAVVGIAVLVTWYLSSQVARALDVQEETMWAQNRALLHARQEIETLQARRARFMRTAAHQLKHPLTGIATMANLIVAGNTDEASSHLLTQKIIRRCRDAMIRVDELLTLARLKESPGVRHGVASTSLDSVVTKMVERYEPVALDKQQTFRCELAFTPRAEGCREICVKVDPRDLEDCVANLVENSIKYTPEGGSICVVHYREGDQGVVRVRDNGPGIDPETQKYLFDEFRRGNQALAQRIAGSGLGLAIVREVVEQAGGSVQVRSPVTDDPAHPGTEFELRFPVCPVESAAGSATVAE